MQHAIELMPSSVAGLHCVSRMPQALGFSISLVVAPQYLFLILLSPLDLCSVHTDSDDLIWLYTYWWLHADLSHPPSHRDLYLCAQLSAHISTWMWEQMLSKPTHFSTLTYGFLLQTPALYSGVTLVTGICVSKVPENSCPGNSLPTEMDGGQ